MGKAGEKTGMSLEPVTAVATAKVYGPLPDDHPCYALIGLITSECARIEFNLDTAIFALAVVRPETGTCITGQFFGMFPRYMALLQLSLDRGLPDSIHKEIEKQSRVANRVAELRNRAVHDAWWEDTYSHEPYQYRTKSKKDTDYGLSSVSVEKLQSDLAEIRKHLDRVMKLKTTISQHLHPKP